MLLLNDFQRQILKKASESKFPHHDAILGEDGRKNYILNLAFFIEVNNLVDWGMLRKTDTGYDVTEIGTAYLENPRLPVLQANNDCW